MDRIHKIHFIEREIFEGIFMVRWATQNFKQLPDWNMCGLKSGRRTQKPLRKRKTRVGKRKAKARQGSSIERHLFYRSGRRKKRDHEKCKKKVGSPYGDTNALQERNERSRKLIGNGSEKLRIRQDFKNKICLCCGSSRVHGTTFGIISTKASC